MKAVRPTLHNDVACRDATQDLCAFAIRETNPHLTAVINIMVIRVSDIDKHKSLALNDSVLTYGYGLLAPRAIKDKVDIGGRACQKSLTLIVKIKSDRDCRSTIRD